MTARIAALAAAAFCLGCAVQAKAQQPAPSVPDRIAVTVNTQQTSDPVTKYEYGQFIEHIGSTMYSSLWAEMLDDRKFYFAIEPKVDQPAAARRGGGMGRMQARKWYPVGPAEAVVMDKEKPFVGDQSPRIALDTATPHGIVQSGIALVNGKKYTGRIYLRGTPSAKVKVSLVWGKGDNDRQTIAMPALSADYKKIPLSFKSKADTQDASLEIVGVGSGSFHIGTLSLMPADNIQGFRPDSTAALAKIKMGFWRYGGNYTSNLIWYHIVGDIDRRPPDFDNAWNAMQPNDLGLDEFMTLCKLIKVEPYISVNAGFGDSHSAAEEVEYMNGAVTTRLGALRAKNGHPEPYHIKYWNIGNEPWGSWQLGRTDEKYYMLKHNEFAKAMRQVDPSIVLIASGLMLQDDNIPNAQRAKYVGNHDALFGTDADWDGGFLKTCWGNFDIIAEHWYANGGHHWDIEKAKTLGDRPSDDAYVPLKMTTLEAARYPADTVRLKAEEWQGYEKRFPAIADKKIKLAIDEYAYFGGSGGGSPFGGANLKQALAYGMILNEMLRYTDFLTMGAQTTGTALIDTNRTGSSINVLGLLYEMYGEHFGAGVIPVALTGNSPQPASKYPAGGPDQPATPSGSPTYPLDMVAGLSPDRKHLVIAVVNATEQQQSFDLGVTGANTSGSAKMWQITADSLDAANRIGQPAQVGIKESALGNAQKTISVAPISVSIYEFPL